MGSGRLTVLGAMALVGAVPATALAFDAASEFAKGTTIVGIQLGGGVQNDIPRSSMSDVSFLNVTPRLSYLFWDPAGPGWLRGSLEVGLEGWFQYYLNPDGATAQGLKAAFRYHFLRFGRLVPYLEVTAGVGGTSLKVKELRSSFTFVLEAGAGISYFLSEAVALNAGYRFHHLSNGGIESPKTGVNADSGVIGVSFFK